MEKIRQKKFFFGMIFATANLADVLAQDLLWLPFWQAGRAPCHFGSINFCSVYYKLLYYHNTIQFLYKS